MTTTTLNPKVYVGTWKKYNEGNLAGAWIDLTTCNTYEDFLRKCAQVHKNERDPEYMVQDCENFPDGLSVTDWLSKEDFDDVKEALKGEEDEEDTKPAFTIVDYSEKAIAVVGDTKPIAGQLKDLGGRFNFRLSCGAGWIFPKNKENEVRAFLQGGTLTESKSAPKCVDGKQFKDEYLKYVDQMNETDYWKDYYRKQGNYAVRLADGWCIIQKPHIENEFCFRDEGPQYDFYCKLMDDKKKLEGYFLSENLSGLEKAIEELEKDEPLYKRHLNNNSIETITHEEKWRWYNDVQMLTLSTEERQNLLSAYKVAKAEFEKRLHAYLKRYGVSKLHTWTYWADR